MRSAEPGIRIECGGVPNTPGASGGEDPEPRVERPPSGRHRVRCLAHIRDRDRSSQRLRPSQIEPRSRPRPTGRASVRSSAFSLRLPAHQPPSDPFSFRQSCRYLCRHAWPNPCRCCDRWRVCRGRCPRPSAEPAFGPSLALGLGSSTAWRYPDSAQATRPMTTTKAAATKK